PRNSRLMKPLQVVENACITALQRHHLHKDAKSRSVGQRTCRSPISLLCCFRFSAEVDHPSGQAQRKLAQVLAIPGPFAAHQLHALCYLNPVSRGVSERLSHIGQQSDCTCSGSLGCCHHECAEVFGISTLSQK